MKTLFFLTLLLGLLAFFACDTRNTLSAEQKPILELAPKALEDSVIVFPFQSPTSGGTARDFVLFGAIAKDTKGELVYQQENVHFRAKRGVVTGVAASNNGVATAEYYPRLQNQVYWDTVTAYLAFNNNNDTVYATYVIRIIPAQQQSTSKVGDISISALPTSIQLRGTGGNEQSTITAYVTDDQRQPVTNGTPVAFQIFSGPSGGETLEKDTAITTNGYAKVTFKSGTKTGIVVIKVSSGTVSAQKSLITIIAGPPKYISINPILTPIQLEAGSSQWIMYLHAKVTDANLNEVDDGWAVNFGVDTTYTYKKLPDTTTLRTDLEGLSINSGSRTGLRFATNASGVLPGLPGIAETYVKFPVSAIFDSIRVNASTNVGTTTITASKIIGFPLPADGVSLSVSSLTGINVIVSSDNDKDTALIQAKLLFGQTPVPGARIRLEPSLGTIVPNASSGVQTTDAAGNAVFSVQFTKDHRQTTTDRVFTADMKVIVENQPGITPAIVTLSILYPY